MEEEKIIAVIQEGFRKADAQFDRIDTQIGRIDGRLDGIDTHIGRIDGRLERIDAQFDEVREQFRELRMNVERLESEMKLWNMKVEVLGGRINRLSDEVKLPSGIVGQRFAELRQFIADGDHQTRILIEKLDTKVVLMGEHVDVVNEKLDRFRATVEGAR